MLYYQQLHDHVVYLFTAIFHMRLHLSPKSPSMTLNTLQLATTCWAKNVTCSDGLRINHRLTELSALSIYGGYNIIVLNVTPKQLTPEDVARLLILRDCMR